MQTEGAPYFWLTPPRLSPPLPTGPRYLLRCNFCRLIDLAQLSDCREEGSQARGKKVCVCVCVCMWKKVWVKRYETHVLEIQRHLIIKLKRSRSVCQKGKYKYCCFEMLGEPPENSIIHTFFCPHTPVRADGIMPVTEYYCLVVELEHLART